MYKYKYSEGVFAGTTPSQTEGHSANYVGSPLPNIAMLPLSVSLKMSFSFCDPQSRCRVLCPAWGVGC